MTWIRAAITNLLWMVMWAVTIGGTGAGLIWLWLIHNK